MQQTTRVNKSFDRTVGGVSIAAAGLWPALGTILFGITVLYFVGFSDLRQAHNAAHDTRHSSGFPCH